MNTELQEAIQNFIVDYDNTVNDESFGLADYDFWLSTAVSLLEQCVKK